MTPEFWTATGLVMAGIIYGLWKLWSLKHNDIHGINEAIKNLKKGVERVEKKIDGHIEDHAKGEFKR